MVYYVMINDKKIGTAKDTTAARKLAVLELLKIDKARTVAYIFRYPKKWIATVSMQSGPDTHIKPSKGYQQGYIFLYDDGTDFRGVWTDGKLRENFWFKTR